MDTAPLGSSPIHSTPLAYGCWRIATTGDTKTDLLTARNAIFAAREAGITFFDLADIYCAGRAESAFGQVLHEHRDLRKKIVIGTKCGIRLPDEATGAPYRYDSTAEYITHSCEQSLKRLGIDRIDVYQIHRPDWLMEVDEVVKALQKLEKQGKIRDVGVSNFLPSQLELLGKALQKTAEMPIIVNQIECSLLQLAPFENGTLDQCMSLNIRPLAWSPLGGGHLANGPVNVLPSQAGYQPQLVIEALDEIAAARHSTRSAIALAWLLRHPSKIIPIIGTTNPERIKEAATAVGMELTREEWYRLLAAAKGGSLP